MVETPDGKSEEEVTSEDNISERAKGKSPQIKKAQLVWSKISKYKWISMVN